MRIKCFLILSLFCSAPLLAQNQNVNLKVTDQFLSRMDHKFILSAGINIPIENGVTFSFPGLSAIVPVRISLSGSDLWLKEANDLPLKANQVHWKIINSDLIILFAKNVLRPGQVLKVEMNSFLPKSVQPISNVSVYSVKRNADDSFRKNLFLNKTKPAQIKQ